MTDLPALVLAASTLVTAVGALVVGLRNSRKADDAREKALLAAGAAEAAKLAAEESNRAIVATKDGIFELGKAVDGRLKELLKVTGALARSEGLAEGLAQGRSAEVAAQAGAPAAVPAPSAAGAEVPVVEAPVMVVAAPAGEKGG